MTFPCEDCWVEWVVKYGSHVNVATFGMLLDSMKAGRLCSECWAWVLAQEIEADDDD